MPQTQRALFEMLLCTRNKPQKVHNSNSFGKHICKSCRNRLTPVTQKHRSDRPPQRTASMSATDVREDVAEHTFVNSCLQILKIATRKTAVYTASRTLALYLHKASQKPLTKGVSEVPFTHVNSCLQKIAPFFQNCLQLKPA